MGAVEDHNSKTHVAGGASAVPTPANNVSGSGSKDGGSKEGSSSYQGPGHQAVRNPLQSTGEFLGLRNQKGAAEAHTTKRMAESGGLIDEEALKSGSLQETCETEDHSFMGRKPGSEPTFMGSETLRSAVDRFTK